MVELVAHRGWSAREPEATRAAYSSAIAWSERTGVPLTLECDVHLSADGELVCLHDLRLGRTAAASGPVAERTLAELRALDFGSWRVPHPTPDQRAMVTLADLLDLVAAARGRGVDVAVAVETKHADAGGAAVEQRVADVLGAYGWTGAGAPVRLLSFSPEALQRLAGLLPDLRRTLLLEVTLGPYADGRLPPGVDAVGPDLRLLRADPGFAGRARARGHAVHAWTANAEADVRFCLDLGVTSVTTDDPDRAVRAVPRWPGVRVRQGALSR